MKLVYVSQWLDDTWEIYNDKMQGRNSPGHIIIYLLIYLFTIFFLIDKQNIHF